MRAIAVLLVVMLASGCVLPRPHHRKALVVNGVVFGAGIGFLVADAIDCRDADTEGCHLHNGGFSPNKFFGQVLILGAVAMTFATAIVVAIQGESQRPKSPRP